MYKHTAHKTIYPKNNLKFLALKEHICIVHIRHRVKLSTDPKNTVLQKDKSKIILKVIKYN